MSGAGGYWDGDNNPFFFQMGEDTFNSLCAPVKRVSLNVLSLHHLSLLAERRAWTHLRDSAAATTDYRTALHIQSGNPLSLLLTNSGEGGVEKFESDLRTFSEWWPNWLVFRIFMHNVLRIMYGTLLYPQRRSVPRLPVTRAEHLV